jgi:UDPglucose--hexose-1-phosphate uridylyltransferase
MGEDHAAAARPHRRYNALRRSWVLVSPQRTARPWQGQTSKPAQAELLHYDPSCYLCPGNHRAGGVTNPQYTGVFAFDNDYPALLPTLEAEGVPASDGLLIAEPEAGRCRVVCFDPDHSLTLADMPVASIETVVAAWQDETRTLGALPEIHYVEIFENRGAMMGASNPHPHCQIWATGHVPDEPKLEGDAQREYFESHGRTLLADYLAQELKSGERLICENDEFAAVVPFWAVWPFETLILPKHPAGSFLDLNSAQASGLAAMLKRVTQTYNRSASPTPWASTSGQSMASRTRNGPFTLIFIRPFCAPRKFANSWWDLRCWVCRSAILPPKAQPRHCARRAREFDERNDERPFAHTA